MRCYANLGSRLVFFLLPFIITLVRVPVGLCTLESEPVDECAQLIGSQLIDDYTENNKESCYHKKVSSGDIKACLKTSEPVACVVEESQKRGTFLCDVLGTNEQRLDCFYTFMNGASIAAVMQFDPIMRAKGFDSMVSKETVLLKEGEKLQDKVPGLAHYWAQVKDGRFQKNYRYNDGRVTWENETCADHTWVGTNTPSSDYSHLMAVESCQTTPTGVEINVVHWKFPKRKESILTPLSVPAQQTPVLNSTSSSAKASNNPSTFETFFLGVGGTITRQLSGYRLDIKLVPIVEMGIRKKKSESSTDGRYRLDLIYADGTREKHNLPIDFIQTPSEPIGTELPVGKDGMIVNLILKISPKVMVIEFIADGVLIKALKRPSVSPVIKHLGVELNPMQTTATREKESQRLYKVVWNISNPSLEPFGYAISTKNITNGSTLSLETTTKVQGELLINSDYLFSSKRAVDIEMAVTDGFLTSVWYEKDAFLVPLRQLDFEFGGYYSGPTEKRRVNSASTWYGVKLSDPETGSDYLLNHK